MCIVKANCNNIRIFRVQWKAFHSNKFEDSKKNFFKNALVLEPFNVCNLHLLKQIYVKDLRY